MCYVSVILFACVDVAGAVSSLCSNFFDVRSKELGTDTFSAKTDFLCRALSSGSRSCMFKWLSLAQSTTVHIGETNPAHANNMRLLKTRGKGAFRNYHHADIKNPQNGLIPDLHFKDHSAFERMLMTCGSSSKFVQQK